MGKTYPYMLAFVMTLFLSGCGEKDQETKEIVRPVKVFHILGPEDFAKRSFPGKVEASQKADLSFPLAEELIELPIKEGEQVKQGQLIAKLNPTNFEIAVAEAKSKVEFAQLQLERTRRLLEKEFASQAEYDAHKTAADVAEAALGVARKSLEDTSLLAPFSGEIARRYVENFQNVQAKQPIVRLQNRSYIDVEIQIPESLAIRSDKLENALFEVEFETALGSRYKAKVKEVAGKADPDTQTYKVTLILPSPKDLNVLPGMTAIVQVKAKIIKDKEEKIFSIPTSTVFSDKGGKSYVWVILPSTNTLKKLEIKIERLVGEDIVVTQGLEPGQNLVAAGVKFLREGEKVNPLETSGD